MRAYPARVKLLIPRKEWILFYIIPLFYCCCSLCHSFGLQLGFDIRGSITALGLYIHNTTVVAMLDEGNGEARKKYVGWGLGRTTSTQDADCAQSHFLHVSVIFFSHTDLHDNHCICKAPCKYIFFL